MMDKCQHCQNGWFSDLRFGADVECVNGVLIDIDVYTEGWEPDVLYPVAPCHPMWSRQQAGDEDFPNDSLERLASHSAGAKAAPGATLMAVPSEVLEAACRAVAADHYSRRFNKSPHDPHVVMNVNANWQIFMHDTKIALEAAHTSAERAVAGQLTDERVGVLRAFVASLYWCIDKDDLADMEVVFAELAALRLLNEENSNAGG